MPKNYDEFLREKLENPEFRKEYEALELRSQLATQVIQLRQKRGLTQVQLAELVGTKQSGISRLENMSELPSLSFLMRVADVLQAKIEIRMADK